MDFFRPMALTKVDINLNNLVPRHEAFLAKYTMNSKIISIKNNIFGLKNLFLLLFISL